MEKTIEELLQEPCWIIDIFPKRIPAERAAQFLAAEKYYLDEPRLAGIKEKHISLVLKLGCYIDLSIDEGETVNPPPEILAEEMRNRHVCILADGALIISEKDDTHLSVFGAGERLLELIGKLTAGEGLFVWKA